MNIIILTGDELRHRYFKIRLANDPCIKVLASFCESADKSLENRTILDPKSSDLQFSHVNARTQSEKDFFENYISTCNDYSNSIFIKKGEINDLNIVENIINYNPDLLVCYGSSLINSKLLSYFKGKFLNVHLGLSPYFRGSGTNVWPLILKQPYMVGATFMHIDEGVDTGEIVHQIRADIFLGDSTHTIGNRLIKKMTDTYISIINNYHLLKREVQPCSNGVVYKMSDFDMDACRTLYNNFNSGMIEKFLDGDVDLPYIVNNKGLSS